jgi:hypothetical protein
MLVIPRTRTIALNGRVYQIGSNLQVFTGTRLWADDSPFELMMTNPAVTVTPKHWFIGRIYICTGLSIHRVPNDPRGVFVQARRRPQIVASIIAMQLKWRAHRRLRHLAVAMAWHGRLGRDSALGTLADCQCLILQYCV